MLSYQDSTTGTIFPPAPKFYVPASADGLVVWTNACAQCPCETAAKPLVQRGVMQHFLNHNGWGFMNKHMSENCADPSNRWHRPCRDSWSLGALHVVRNPFLPMKIHQHPALLPINSLRYSNAEVENPQFLEDFPS